MLPSVLFSRTVFDAIGSVAAFCTTVSFLPQLVRVWRRKRADDISLTMFLLFSFGVACWLVYGVGIGSFPITVANAITLSLALAILVLKLRYHGWSGGKAEETGSPVN
jgi:MtN3 and saliva related transmembrane protein